VPDPLSEKFRGDARLDLDAAGLTGTPTDMVVEAAVAPLKSAPDPYGPLGSTLLHGEAFAVYETVEGWCRGRAGSDGYIGYVPAATLGEPRDAPTHAVALPATHLYAAPTIKAEPLGMLFLNAAVTVTSDEGAFHRLSNGLHIERTHLTPLSHTEADFAAVARMFHHAPYLWGGNTVQGIDCSGLVQMAMHRCGHAAPRDSDMQEAMLGEALATDSDRKRGDLVFWPGHVGIMTGPETILHATEHTLRVVEEPFPAMRLRLAAAGLNITSVKRL